jgi:glycosyltransferase involved in cell wall biosynthesis
LSEPLSGYQILPSENGHSLYSLEDLGVVWNRFRTVCLTDGASEVALAKFIETRPLELQKDIGCEGVDLIFYPSVPLHVGQHPWVVEIEDSTTLFFPFLANGKTSTIGDPQNTDYYPIIKNLLEQDSCKAIITHVKSTADSMSVLFDEKIMSPKVFHIPMGVSAPSGDKVASNKTDDPLAPKFLISNSWHQDPGNFYLRGGLDSIKAFAEIKVNFPKAELIIRAKLPADLPEKFQELIEECEARVVDDFLPSDEWERLKLSTNFFLIPSARIHIVSMLEAMAYGMILVASDGWGIEEYATDGLDAVLITGRKKVSHIDMSSGILSEDYTPMYSMDFEIVQQIVEKVSALILEPTRQDAMRREARKAIVGKYSIEQFNARLGKILDLL